MQRLLFYFLLFFQAYACNESKVSHSTDPLLSNEAQEIYSDLSAIHDTAMLLMSPIAGVKIQLRRHLDSEDSISSQILTHLSTLKEAEDWMMRWMNEFKNVDLDREYYQSQKKDSIYRYLQQEKVKVEQLHQFMQDALSNAKQFNRSIGNS